MRAEGQLPRQSSLSSVSWLTQTCDHDWGGLSAENYFKLCGVIDIQSAARLSLVEQNFDALNWLFYLAQVCVFLMICNESFGQFQK